MRGDYIVNTLEGGFVSRKIADNLIIFSNLDEFLDLIQISKRLWAGTEKRREKAGPKTRLHRVKRRN